MPFAYRYPSGGEVMILQGACFLDRSREGGRSGRTARTAFLVRW